MPDNTEASGPHPARPEWFLALAQYERPVVREAVGQMLNTFLPYLALWGVMLFIVTHRYPYWVTLLLSLVAAGFLVRAFIFLHDCCHGSFFSSPRANTILGTLVGIMTMTPYTEWRWTHLLHHASFGNLDRRGLGDIRLMTVEEYLAASRMARLSYRIYRHPLFLFPLGAPLLFTLVYRYPIAGAPPRERFNVWLTDGAILALIALACLTIGWRTLLLVQGPVLFFAWTFGVWMFYVQHQFPGVQWAHEADWDFIRAALGGCSYYKLPRVLQWITGNIGLHHLHHLRPRIPNHRLQQAFDATPAVQGVTPLTPLSSLQCLRLNVWDEQQHKLIGFSEIHS